MDAGQLQEILAAHREWLSSGKTKGRQASLVGKDLRFADLTGVDLTEGILTDANLERATLTQTRLNRADLRGANLAYADATGAQLAHANLASGRLDGARLDGANLSDAKLANANLEHVSLRRAVLAGALASGAKFSHADLSLADLDRCVLTNADFHGAAMAHASLRGATADRARFTRATMTGVDVDGATFRSSDFTESVLISVRLESAILDGAKVELPGDDKLTPSEKVDLGAEGGGVLEQLAAGVELRARLNLATRQLEHARLAFRRAGAELAESAALSSRIAVLEDERRLLLQDIQRAEQDARRIQADFAARISAATTALRAATARGTINLRRLKLWSYALRFLGLAALVLAAMALAPARSPLSLPLLDSRIAGLPASAVVFLIMAFCLFWLDARNGREVSQLSHRRYRVEEAIALLQASQFVSRDVTGTQDLLYQTFTLVRDALIERSPHGAAITSTKAG